MSFQMEQHRTYFRTRENQNPDNPEKTFFRIIEVFRCLTKKMDFSICFGRSKKPLLIPRQFGKLLLI